MWEELKDLLGEMVEDENLSFSLTPEERASELLMIVVRRKVYENVLDLMTHIEAGISPSPQTRQRRVRASQN